MVSATKENAGEIFDRIVNEKGLKKTFIARQIGVSPQTLNYKIHHGGFNADLAFKVARVLSINPVAFLAGSYTSCFKVERRKK